MATWRGSRRNCNLSICHQIARGIFQEKACSKIARDAGPELVIDSPSKTQAVFGIEDEHVTGVFHTQFLHQFAATARGKDCRPVESFRVPMLSGRAVHPIQIQNDEFEAMALIVQSHARLTRSVGTRHRAIRIARQHHRAESAGRGMKTCIPGKQLTQFDVIDALTDAVRLRIQQGGAEPLRGIAIFVRPSRQSRQSDQKQRQQHPIRNFTHHAKHQVPIPR